MSNQSQRNDQPAPLTRAQKRAAKRARQAKWRQSPQGKRHIAARQCGYQERNARLMSIPDGHLFE